jgi:hypothetical protein
MSTQSSRVADAPRLSAHLAKAALTIAAIEHELTDSRITSGDTNWFWPQIDALELFIDLIKSALLEAEEFGEYRPEGRRPLRLAGDEIGRVGGLRKAA